MKYYEISAGIKNESFTQEHIGNVHYYQGDTETALQYWVKGLDLLRQQENFDIERAAKETYNCGLLYRNILESDTAISYLNEALALSKKIYDKKFSVLILNVLGNMYMDKEGQESNSLSFFMEGLHLAEEIGDISGEADCLLSISRYHHRKDNMNKAIYYNRESLQKAETIEDKWLIGWNLVYLGLDYFYLGNFEKALEVAGRAKTIAFELQNAYLALESLGCLGSVYLKKQEYGKAIEYFETGLEILESVYDVKRKREFFRVLSEAYRDLRQFDTALEYAGLSLELAGEDYQGDMHRSRVYNLLGSIYFQKGDYDQGEEYYSQSLSLAEKNNRAFSIYYAQLGLGKTYWKQNRYQDALDMLTKAIDTLEIMRTIQEQDELKLDFMHSSIDTYQTMISLLLEMDTMEPEKGYDAMAYYYVEASKSRGLLDLLVDAEVGDILTLEEVQREIIEDDMVGQFRDNVESLLSPGFYSETAYDVFETILSPALEGLLEGTKLLVITDGPLQYLPFEALVTEDTKADSFADLPYLINRYAVSYVQSASIMAQLEDSDQSENAKELLAFGDPVFKEDSVSQEVSISRSVLSLEDISRLKRIEYTGVEVAAIGTLFDYIDVYTREAAIEERVKDTARLAEYRFIHFATHGIINENNPQYSGLILTQDDDPAEDGFLQMDEIAGLSLDAEMVVLSACETGLGKKVNGEGMVNLTRAFMYAGARSVAVSLWNVADQSTAELMTGFYKKIQQGQSKYEALRAAKLEMVSQHPYYWAGFVLFGRE